MHMNVPHTTLIKIAWFRDRGAGGGAVPRPPNNYSVID